MPLENNAKEFNDLKDMDFAQLDSYLEQKAKQQQENKEETSSNEKENIDQDQSSQDQ